MASTFVGRDRELETLADLGRPAGDAGRALAVLVTGEPGIGKGRLLAEGRARLSGLRQIQVVGYEPERRVPLAAARELLLALDALPSDLGSWTAAMEPLQIFEAAYRGLEAFGPVLLVIDDVQWVDERSLALCHYLVRASVGRDRVLGVLAAGRHGQAMTTFSGSVGSVLAGTGRVEVIELEPLGLEDGVELVREIWAGVGAQAPELWSRAAGSPYWLQTLATERGIEATGASLPFRAGSMDADASALVAILAAAGRPEPVERLAEVAGWDDARTARAVEGVVDAGVVVAAAGVVAFTHDLVRARAEAEVGADVLRELHARWASLLEAAARDTDDVAILRAALEHRAAAGLDSIDLAVRLAGSPRRRWLGDDGVAFLASIADAGSIDDLALLELEQRIAALAAETGAHDVALERWSRLADALPDPIARTDAVIAAGRSAAELRRRDDARSLIERARAGRLTEVQLVELDALDARVSVWLEHRGADGWAIASRAVEGGRRLAGTDGRADAPDPRGKQAYLEALEIGFESAIQADASDEVVRLTDELIEASRGSGDATYLRAIYLAGVAQDTAGATRASELRFRHVWADARQRHLPTIAVDAGFFLTQKLLQLGELDEAAGIIEETRELARRTGDFGRFRARTRMTPWELAFLRGLRREAVEGLLAGLADQPDPHHRIAFHQALALWFARLDGPAAADEIAANIGAGRGHAAEARCPRCRLGLEIAAAEALVRAGDPAAARRTIDAWDTERSDPIPMDRVWRIWVEGLLAGAEGRTGEAMDFLGVAASDADRLDARLDAELIRLDRAWVMTGVDRGAAAEAFREVASRTTAMGAASYARLAERGLRRLGVRTWRRGPSGPEASQDRLSPRERDVAILVASGATNPEIAAALFLSRKTVERHVSNVLAKMDVRNRAELAGRFTPPPNEGSAR